MNYINLKLALAIIVVALVPPINARAQSNCDTIATLPHGTYTFIFKECGYENHRQEYTI